MSKSGLLYVKGMNIPESEEEAEDVWDDTVINAAYDKAMKVANVEVAKRLAMATNSRHGDNEGSAKKKTFKSEPEHQLMKPSSHWKAGMPCRAVYKEDGLEYEALIIRILTNDRCIVQFLGYNNRDIVKTSSLKQTLGKEMRTVQCELAATEECDDDESPDSPTSRRGSMDVDSDRAPSPGSTERSFQIKKKSKKRNHSIKVNDFELPDIPVPNLNMMGNLGSMEIPMPMPPPLSMSSHGLDTEEQAMSSMMLSWYMSGYYTGLYQGIKRAKEQRRRKNN